MMVNKKIYKMFTLLYGKEVHLTGDTKVLSASEFATLNTAEELLRSIREDAERYRKEVIEECEHLKAEAARDGFASGFATWSKQLATLEERNVGLEHVYEQVLAPVALKAAKKIVGNELQQREVVIVDIVSKTLKAVAQHKRIVIWVNKQHLHALEEQRPRLKALFEDLQVLSIRERDDIAPGGCVVETEGGIINAQLENQWQILEEAFETMMQARSKQE